MFFVEFLDIKKLLHQPVTALYGTKFDFLDYTGKIIFPEIAVYFIDCRFDFSIVLIQITDLSGNTLDNACILATGTCAIFFNLSIRNEFVQF